jgi:hypothetical protein
MRACIFAWLAVGTAACAGRMSSSAPLGAPEPSNVNAKRTEPESLASPSSGSTRAHGRFYASRQYGSEMQFNPLSVIVNEGWDMLRLVDDREIFKRPYAESWGILTKSLLSPGAAIKEYGVSRWLRNEVLPLTFGGKGGQWEPNYHLHMFGAGMTYARTAEWYEQHDVSHPRIAAAATLYASHIANEVIENIGHPGLSTDGITDLLIFDPAGMLLWNTEWMQRTFSGRVEMTNWFGQPVLSQPNNRLENAYSMFMLRTPLPHTEDWKFLTTGGNAFLAGVSRRIGREHWLSVTAGAIPVDVPVIDSATNTRSVIVRPNAGIFLDRNGSLLASVVGQNGMTNGPTLNVYPGVLGSGRWSPGFFVQAATGGVDGHGLRFGIASSHGFGIGRVARRPTPQHP